MSPIFGKRKKKVTSYIAVDDVMDMYARQGWTDANWDQHLTQQDYALVDQSDMDNFAWRDDSDLDTWVKDRHDCAHFAQKFVSRYNDAYPGAAVFYTRIIALDGQAHCVVSYITTDKKIRFLEPQDDKVTDAPPDGWVMDFLFK